MLPQSADYRSSVYAPVREFDGKMIFTYNGTSTTFYDDKIISMNVIEEMNTINNTLPSNECSIVMDNTSGDFNMLTYDKMYQIIASKPKIEAFLGLVTAQADAQTVTSDFLNKKSGSLVENPNKSLTFAGATIQAPPQFVLELKDTAIGSWDSYASLYYDDNKNTEISTSGSGTILQMLHSFNIFQILERKFGTGIWGGKTAVADKIAIANSYIKSYNCTAKIFGNTSGGNKASFSMRYGYNADGTGTGTWSQPPVVTTSASKTNVNIYSTLQNGKIDANGYVHFLVYGDPNPTPTLAKIQTEYILLSLDLNPIKAIEWMPIGVFNLINWRNQVGNMTIQLTGRDSFDLLNDISYNNTTSNTLYNLAVDIFTQSGITNYSIDDSLKNMTGSFNDRVDMRTALQHIGVASRAAVYQDRYGVMQIKPFSLLDQSSNYLSYSGQPQMVSGTYWATPLVSTGGGMKYIDMDYQYIDPLVQLDKSIYELIVRVYTGTNYVERRYVNTLLGGNNGASFTIDNPLIEDVATADAVAEWYIRENNYNAIYNAQWRQNPVLECGDIILIEDSFGANKQTRITHQEFAYSGYLEGQTQSRGGI